MTIVITPALLENACQSMTVNAAKFAAPLTAACERYSINTPQRLAAFLAQIAHESGSLGATSESFNYAIPALMATFPRVMTYAVAVKYGRQPNEKAVPLERQQQIASMVYANKYGNGNAASGDGWKYRGSGLVQTTFKANFADAAKDIGVDIVANPDLVRNDPATAALVAGFFWINHGLNALADAGEFDAITRRINPAMVGADARRARWAKAKAALGI
jgi:putative chitinase